MNLLLWLDRALASLDERSRKVLGKRLGLRSEPLTLVQIGDEMGLTRERVRQLEGYGFSALEAEATWFRELEEDLFQTLAARSWALSLLGAEEVDERLHGVGRRPSVLAYLLQKLGAQRIFLVSVSDVFYLLDLPQANWDKWLSQSRKNLRSVSWAGWSESRCRDEVIAAKPEVLAATGDLLWQVLREQFGFDALSTSSALVPSTVEQAVRQVLAEAAEPVHYLEVCERVDSLMDKGVSQKSILNVVSRTGILLGRGVYGLPRHIRVNDAHRASLVESVEARMAKHESGRQWHAKELLEGLQMELGFVPGLDQYVLDVLLRKSSQLKRLGRLVWQLDTTEATIQERINIQQAVVDILREAASPMTTEAIYDRLVQRRGLGRHFQVQTSDEVQRLGQNLWGLSEWGKETPLLDVGPSAET